MCAYIGKGANAYFHRDEDKDYGGAAKKGLKVNTLNYCRV
jgi:hypothetical protein